MILLKNACIAILIPLVSWHCFLGIRDSDGTMFEYRVKGAMQWCALNIPKYVEIVEGTMSPTRKNQDGSENGHKVKKLEEIAGVIVSAHAHLAAFTCVMLLLGSKIGTLMGMVHSLFMILALNFNIITPYILKF